MSRLVRRKSDVQTRVPGLTARADPVRSDDEVVALVTREQLSLRPTYVVPVPSRPQREPDRVHFPSIADFWAV